MQDASPTEGLAAPPSPGRSPALRFGAAVLATLIATLVRLGLGAVLGENEVPFITFFPAVVLTAWLGGFWPGALAVILGALAASRFFIQPTDSMAILRSSDQWSVAVFVFTGLGISALGEAQRRAQLQFEESGKLVDATLRSIGDAVLTTDDRGRITLLNDVAERLTGWTEDEARGRPHHEVFRISNADTGETVESPVDRVLREGVTVGLANHTVLTARDGSVRPIDDSGAPIRGLNDAVRGAVLVFRDVTERERRERRRQFFLALNDRIRTIADPEEVLWITVQAVGLHLGLSRCLYVDIDHEKQSVTIRRDYCRDTQPSMAGVYPLDLWQKEVDEAGNGDALVYVDVATDPRSAADYETAYAPFQVRAFVSAQLIKEGRLVAALVAHSSTPRDWHDEEIDLLNRVVDQTWLAVDNARNFRAAQEELAQRRVAEAERERYLHEVEGLYERLRLALAAAHAGDWGWDLQTDRVTCSDRAAEIVGIPPGPVMTWTEMQEYLHEDDRERARRAVERAIVDRTDYNIEYRITRPYDSVPLWISASGRGIYLPDGTPTGMLGVLMDITDRKRAEEEMRTLNVRLQRAMRETHHRVKNNLQVMAAIVDLQAMEHLNSGMVPLAEMQRLSTLVHTLALVHDLLTQNLREEEEDQRIPIKQVLDRLLPLLRHAAGDRPVRAQVDDAALTGKQCTAVALLVNELVSNGFKHGGTEVGVTLAVRDGAAELTVRDNGRGFPEGFDPLLNANTGLQLIETVTRADLGSAPVYQNHPEGGACVSATFPLPVQES